MVIKKAVLDAYAVTSEGYHQKFCNYVKPHIMTWTEFAAEKLRLFRKWLDSDVVTYEELNSLIVTEEFKRRLPQNIMFYIADKEEKDLKKAAVLADNYSLIRKGSLGNVKQHRAEPLGDKDGKTDRGLFCNYCKKEGHMISNCPNPACKRGKLTENRAPVKVFPGYKSDAGKESVMHCVSQDKNLFEKFICNGTISLHSTDKPIKVRMLRDTGSNQSILIKSVVPNLTLLDEKVVVRDLTDTKLLPLTEVFMDCLYVTSKVKMAVREGNFPLQNVQVLLGNDLAGELLLPNLIMYETPGIIEESENERDRECQKEEN
ncbi:uncharacterized protein [Palaemon carinicauda]|uniref:uncharacterized protein n=1 Tax=Palaemon carinicauda TaxID=392227 RepID=UPI0035B613DC